MLRIQRPRAKARTLRAVFEAALAAVTLASLVLAGLAARAAAVPKPPPHGCAAANQALDPAPVQDW